MNVLIYGAGAIGSHIAYCMHSAGNTVFLLARGKHFEQMKQNVLHIKILDNNKLKGEAILKESSEFFILDSLGEIPTQSIDYIFITVKLSSYTPEIMKDLQPFMSENTAIIPPCTKLPFWWFYSFAGE
jgi:2-dehydropantoate 2-reductase